MVACLEKSDENAEFHQIVDFLSTCSINYALTVSPTIYASYIEQFWNTATSKIINSVKQIHAIVDGKAVVISESSVRSDLLFNDEDGVTCLTNDEIFENLALMGYEQLSTKLTFQKEPQIASLHIETSPTATPQTEAHQTAVSQIVFHEAHIEQILLSLTTYQRKRKTQKCRRTKKDTKLPQTSVPLDHGADEAVHKKGVTRMDTGGSPRRQDTMGGTPGQTRDNVPSTPHDSPLLGGYTPRSDEGRMKLDELITMCTKLSKQVLDLEKEKDAQAVEILKLKRREDASKQGRRSDKLEPMFNDKDFEDLNDYMENVKEETVDDAATRVSTVSALVSTAGKAKEKGVAITDIKDSSRIVRPPLPSIDPKDKGKGVLVEEEPVKQESAKSDKEATADYEHEKEELRMWLTVVSDEEETVDPKILSAKYPIVDWESQNLGNVDMEDLHVYKIIRADRNTSYHKSLSSMLRIFDRQDLVDLHRLVMKRFEDTTPEGYNLLLWRDLKVIVHTLLMDGTLTSFNMLVEKRYPLIKEMLQKMLNWKLEAEAESTMAFELLKFIKSKLEE
ncbi:hypothetical protein Tco_0375682 [Tanacetum coccineum]